MGAYISKLFNGTGPSEKGPSGTSPSRMGLSGTCSSGTGPSETGDTKMSTSNNLQYIELSKNEAPDIWPLLEKAFFPHEPITLGISATPEDMKNFACAGIDKWTTSGLSTGVRDTKTKQLVGVMLVNTITKDDPTTFTNLGEDENDKIKETRAVLAHLEKKFNVFEAEKVDKAAEMAMMAVDPAYAKKGIATTLVKNAEELVAKNGITIAYSQASNIASQKVFGKCGYATRDTVDYETFEMAGKRILDVSKMEGTKHCTIVTKKIEIPKENK